MFTAALLSVLAIWAGINLAVDPFGTFGGGLIHWDSYSQTLNPRISKAKYIAEHKDEYDSYILGSSSAASYLPETLNKYTGNSFYNMFHYGANLTYDRELTEYLLNTDDDIKDIVLVIGINEAIESSSGPGGTSEDLTYYSYCGVSGECSVSYYARFLFADPGYAIEKILSRRKDTIMPQTFDVFLPDFGTYDKRMRNAESIGDINSFIEAVGNDFNVASKGSSINSIDKAVSEVSRIKELCENAGVDFTLILTPAYSGQFELYTEAELQSFYCSLAEVSDYWNFQISSVSYDPRYFYDSTHTRNSTADMVLARIFDDTSIYFPEDFGIICSSGNVPSVSEMTKAAVSEETAEAVVPVLLYHNIAAPGEGDDSSIDSDTFSHHMELLSREGYTPVSTEALIDFVLHGKKLPERPVVITFDDGYMSNYELAYPILKEYGYPATIFVIGCSVGHDRYYKDTEYLLTPHFGKAEIDDMLSSGLISIQSHTYDMHQWPPFESSEQVRNTLMPFDGESDDDYVTALREDAERQAELFRSLGIPESHTLAFPSGKHLQLADAVLLECGYSITMTTDRQRVNTLISGVPQSLIDIGRMNIAGTTTDEDIIDYLEMR